MRYTTKAITSPFFCHSTWILKTQQAYIYNSIAVAAKWINTAKWTVLLTRFLVFVIRTSKIFDIKMKEGKKEKPSDILIKILSLNYGWARCFAFLRTSPKTSTSMFFQKHRQNIASLSKKHDVLHDVLGFRDSIQNYDKILVT